MKNNIALVEITGRKRNTYINKEEQGVSYFSFCIIDGVPREHQLPKGIYMGNVKSIIKDRYGNEVPIIEKIYPLHTENSEENILEIEIPLNLCSVKNEKIPIVLKLLENVVYSWDLEKIQIITNILLLVDKDIVLKELFEEQIDKVKGYLDVLEINKEEVLEKIKKEKEKKT